MLLVRAAWLQTPLFMRGWRCAGGHGPAHLQKRIDAFLEGAAGRLGSIDEAEFEGHRAALIAAKLQKDHALGDEADRNWEQISNRRCLTLCCIHPCSN